MHTRRGDPTRMLVTIATVGFVVNTTRAMIGHILMPRYVPWNIAGLAEPIRWALWIAATPLLAWIVRLAESPPSWRTQIGRHLASVACLAPLHGLIVSYVAFQLMLLAQPPDRRQLFLWNPPVAISGAVIDAVWGYCVIMGFYYAITSQYRMQERVLKAAELEASLNQAQLEALQSQLQPHFLFNVLHSTSMLVATNGAAARDMLVRLSDLLRRSLSTRHAFEVPLDEELEFLERYLGIERVRLAERLRVAFDIDPAARRALVPTLTLQPLVENAIRHGITRAAAGGTIIIQAEVKDSSVLLRVENDGVGSRASTTSGERSSGLGIANLAARLNQLYPDNHQFHFGERPDARGWIVRVVIPLRHATAAATGGFKS